MWGRGGETEGAGRQQTLRAHPSSRSPLFASHHSYCNLYTLLRHHLSESAYLAIVRNKILVDVQGEDLLFQIFTANILQSEVIDEAPFFEFIQRVCSECLGADGCPAKIKPGCGGFGIRNFLTLFLSIEVSKAMTDAKDAKATGDDKKLEVANKKVRRGEGRVQKQTPLSRRVGGDEEGQRGNTKG